MNVRELLQSKKEAVITIDAEDTIGAAAQTMPRSASFPRRTSCAPWPTTARRPAAG